MKNGRSDRRTHRGSHSRDRRDSERQQQEEPDHRVNDRSDLQTRKRKKYSEEGGNAFPATKSQPNRIEMPDQRTGRGESSCLVPEQPPREQDRGCRLETVEQQCQRGEQFATRPQHIGRTDVARADLADVTLAGEPRNHQTKRDRPEQISERQSEEHLAGHVHRGSKPERLRNLRLRPRRATQPPWTRPPPSFSSIPAWAGCRCWRRRARCCPARRSSMPPTVPAFPTASAARLRSQAGCR